MTHSRVIRSTGSWYRLRDEASGEEFDARLSGRLRLRGARSTNPVVVGDVVEVAAEGGEATIVGILPRRTYIIRRSSNLSHESHILAANVDRALLVATLFSPATSYEFIDRFLVTCEAYGIPATIALNKIDLARQQPEALEAFRSVYALAGYPVIELSALAGEGIEAVRALTGSGTTLLSGNSGVGKSTIIRCIDPAAEVRIADISQAHGKGRHTTTFSRMYPLSGGGYIVDTPGIKGFGLIDIAPAEIARYFPDLMRRAPGCQYHNCTHVHEPGCAVVRAVEAGEIAYERYVSYMKMLDEDGKYR